MAKSHGPQIKDDKCYEELRRHGMSKEMAARIANEKAAGGRPSRKGGKSPSYEDWNKDELYNRAREIGIDGRSQMSKAELIRAIRHH